MTKLRAIIKKYDLAIVLVYWIIHLSWYSILQAVTMGRESKILIHSVLDDMVPFCEWFVIPYCMWFFYIFAVSLFLYLKDKKNYRRLYVYMFIGMFFCMSICSIIPMYHDLHPTVYPDNFAGAAVKYLHQSDNPTTIMPSMHVYVAVALCLAVFRSDAYKHKFLIRTVSLILSTAICLSIVMIKQHSVLDGIAALVLCAVVYIITRYLERKTNYYEL